MTINNDFKKLKKISIKYIQRFGQNILNGTHQKKKKNVKSN